SCLRIGRNHRMHDCHWMSEEVDKDSRTRSQGASSGSARTTAKILSIGTIRGNIINRAEQRSHTHFQR
ncbi:MAG TPA: hypothetical protein VKF42_02510, partial [Chitinivibrionales bacterium]|nr:hypothetical protein [Chitinivibrionales bacterium]